jgi:hypothetical protein
MTHPDARVGGTLIILFVLTMAPAAFAWGPEGHAIVVRIALDGEERLPPWFREASAALGALANAPDRWRELERSVPALGALGADHFFDVDDWGDEQLPPDRWAYVARAARRRLHPEKIGFLPFAILERYGELLGAFRDVQAGRPGGREAALATAGVLAHLVGDAAVPLHVTRHHHGWVGPNPEGFTRASTVHAWFESTLVTRLDPAVIPREPEAERTLGDVPGAVRALLADSLAQVPRLYRVERESRRSGDDGPARELVRERLEAGATLLARLWRTAWVRSGG